MKQKDEVSKLKEDFERLQSIFEVTKNASKKDTKEIDEELANVREQFRVTKEENIYLKEKNDTLFKLGRMAIEKESAKESILEIVEQEDQDGLYALVHSVIQNKKSSSSSQTSATSAQNVNQENSSSNIQQSRKNTQTSSARKENSDIRKTKFCHYFSNFGHCKFEEDTGRKCKFEHKKAPTCKFGRECNREKCMYSHQQLPLNANNSGRNPRTPFLHRSHPTYNRNQNWQPQPPVWMLQQMWEIMANQPHH